MTAPELARVNGEATVPERVEEIDLDAVLTAPSPPAKPATPPPPPPGRHVTAAQVPPPADTLRDAPLSSDAREDDVAPAPMPALAEIERPSAATIVEDAAEFYCQSCERRVPRAEIQVLTRDGRKTFAVCPVCNQYLGAKRERGAEPARRSMGAMAPAAARPRAERPPVGSTQRSLQWTLVDALAWPVTRQVLPTLLGLTCIVWLSSSAWAFGHRAAEIAGLLLGCLALAARAAAIILATHRGDDAPPPLFDDDWLAVLRHALALLVGGLPLLVALSSEALGVRSPTGRTILVVAGIVVFSLHAPAGQIVVAARETLVAGLDPLRPIRFALRVGRAYLVPCIVFLSIAIVHLVAVSVTRMVGVALFGGPTVAWGLVASLVVVAGVLVEARVLGLVVREHGFALSLVRD
jgi:hypothetical protein